MSHTYAKLNISQAAFVEIAKLLREAGYDQSFHTDIEGNTIIDMHGIGLHSEDAEKMRRLDDENTALPMIAAKVMPCHYCGVDEIAKCPHGFPGCALADDVMAGDSQLAHEVHRLRKLVH